MAETESQLLASDGVTSKVCDGPEAIKSSQELDDTAASDDQPVDEAEIEKSRNKCGPSRSLFISAILDGHQIQGVTSLCQNSTSKETNYRRNSGNSFVET